MPMNWRGTRVLVTGAGGFIGSHLVEELARRGARVRALVRYNARASRGLLERIDPELAARVEVVAGDVRDRGFMDGLARSQEVAFHLAALIAIPYSYQAPESFVDTNVRGTLNVLEACLRRGVRRLVHTSTSEVYGTALYAPMDERHPLQGQSPYSASKIGADALAESFHRSFGLPVAVARPFNAFGPRQSARAVLPAIMSQLLAGPGELRLGALDPVRDFTYVADTVRGFLAVAASPRAVGEVVNIGSGRATSIGQAAARVQRLLGVRAWVRKDEERVRPDKSEVRRLLCDNRKALRLAGWRPRYSFDEGLALALDYVRAHLDEHRPGTYSV